MQHPVDEKPSPLTDLKVLDLAGPIGVYCTKLLADLGADVIRIEPPTGDPMRDIAPLHEGQPDRENSLYWWHFNTSKRGVTLDLEQPEGQELFKRLIKWADIAVESFVPGYMASLGIGFENLAELNPGLILTSVTPFGQHGPYSEFKGPDIGGQAMSGVMQQVGFDGRAPYTIATESAYWSAAIFAANATMLAVTSRDFTGVGQQIDVSMQRAMSLGAGNAIPTYDVLGEVLHRGDMFERGRGQVRAVLPCKDGYIFFIAAAPGTSMEAVHDLMADYGFGDKFDLRWLDAAFVREDPVERQRFENFAVEFFSHYTRRELMDMAFNREKQVFAVPTDTPEDVANSPQLIDRGFFVDVDHPGIDDPIRYLGPPFRLPESPWRLTRRAPELGQHNEEVYHDMLGIGQNDLARLTSKGVI